MIMRFKIVLPKKAQKDLAKVDFKVKGKILLALKSLENDPYLGKKLAGGLKKQRSYRVWPYRIVYEIIKNDLVILILRVASREGAYNKK